MSLRRLITPGSKVSRIGLGCEQLGGTDWGDIDIEQASGAVAYAWDSGITVFDTADVYGLGNSEKRLAAALGTRRHEAFVITKGGVRWKESGSGRAKTIRDNSPEYIRKALEASLRRLQIEAVPLYLIHWPDAKTPVEVVVKQLEELRVAGKVLNFGLSNFSRDDIRIGLNFGHIAAYEGVYNLLDRKTSKAAFALATETGMATFAYGPLAQGLLAGKYSHSCWFPENDRRHRLPQFQEGSWPSNKRVLERVRAVAERYCRSYSEVAIRWVLDEGSVDCAIVGGRSREQVDSNIAACDWKMEENDIRYLSGD